MRQSNAAQTFGALRLRYGAMKARRRFDHRALGREVRGFIIGFLIATWLWYPRLGHAAELTCDPAELGASCAQGAKLVFGDRFPMPPEIEGPCGDACEHSELIVPLTAYVHKWNRNVDALWTAETICNEWQCFPSVPLEAVMPTIARESHFYPYARNGGFYGWPQLGQRWHRAPLEAQGWTWGDPASMVRYMLWHIDRDLAAGKSLDQAMHPWEVWYRYGARQEYETLIREGWPQQ